jgi:hypothetical protein
MVLGMNGGVIDRSQRELSVCEQGRRHGTWIDTIDGKRVHRYERASSARASLPPPPPTSLARARTSESRAIPPRRVPRPERAPKRAPAVISRRARPHRRRGWRPPSQTLTPQPLPPPPALTTAQRRWPTPRKSTSCEGS